MTEPAPMYVSTFEGAVITEMEGRLPAITLDLPEGYTRGTHLRFEVEVRVKSVRHEETKRGDVVRQHVFGVESIALKHAFQPEEVADSVGGSASASPPMDQEAAAELGVQFGRTSDQWGQGEAVGF